MSLELCHGSSHSQLCLQAGAVRVNRAALTERRPCDHEKPQVPRTALTPGSLQSWLPRERVRHTLECPCLRFGPAGGCCTRHLKSVCKSCVIKTRVPKEKFLPHNSGKAFLVTGLLRGEFWNAKENTISLSHKNKCNVRPLWNSKRRGPQSPQGPLDPDPFPGSASGSPGAWSSFVHS